VIQLLQSKVRTTKLKLYQGNSGGQQSTSTHGTACTNNKSIRLSNNKNGAQNNLESLNDVISQKLNINYSTINVKATSLLNGSYGKLKDEDTDEFVKKMNKSQHFQTIDKLNNAICVNNSNSSAHLIFNGCNQDSCLEIDSSETSNSTTGN
jgi:hypothetical protein